MEVNSLLLSPFLFTFVQHVITVYKMLSDKQSVAVITGPTKICSKTMLGQTIILIKSENALPGDGNALLAVEAGCLTPVTVMTVTVALRRGGECQV